MNHGSAMDTMVANSIGRSSGDTAFRDMIGDSTEGAMGTHIGNHQGLASNVMSDYNKGRMTDVELNQSIIDATRGYEELNLEAADYSSNFNTSPSSHYSLYDSNGPGYGQVTTDVSSLSSSMHQTPERQEFTGNTNGHGALFKREPVQSKINNELSRDLTIVPILKTSVGHEPQKITNDTKSTTGTLAEEEDTEKKQSPSISKSTGVGTLRPVELPTKESFLKITERKKLNKKEILTDKLSRASDEKIVKLVEKSGEQLKKALSQEEKIIASCKLSLLNKEAIKRFQ